MTDTSGINIGTLNPFSYRSYYYDDELDVYYLQSRYYYPYNMKFLSPDSPEYLTDQSTLVPISVYGYCENEPIEYVDPEGSFSVKTALSKIKQLSNKIVGKFWSYIKSLIIYNKTSRILSISTTAISTTIDLIITAVTNALIYRGLKNGLKFLLKYKKIRNSLISSWIEFLLYTTPGKFVLRRLFYLALKVAGKKRATEKVMDSLFQGFVGNILTNKNIFLQKSSSLISAFSSIGGCFALVFDVADGKWDDYFRVKV